MTATPDLRKHAKSAGLPTMTALTTANHPQKRDLRKRNRCREQHHHLPTMTRSTR